MVDTKELRSMVNGAQFESFANSVIHSLLDRLEAAEKANAESLAMYRRARDERDTYKAAYNEWIAKTEWVQDEITRGNLSAKYLGLHRADGIKVEIDSLRAKIEQMERQKPVGEIVAFGESLHEVSWNRGKLPPLGAKIYALPGAKGEEK